MKRDEWEKEKRFSDTKMSIRCYVYFLQQEIYFDKGLGEHVHVKLI